MWRMSLETVVEEDGTAVNVALFTKYVVPVSKCRLESTRAR